MKQTFSVLFIPKYDKPNKYGEVPIYYRITVDGKRSEMSTGVSVDPTKWSQDSELIKGKGNLVQSKNHSLRKMRDDLLEVKYELLDRNEWLTAKKIKNNYLGVNEVIKSIVEVTKEYNLRLKNLIGNGYSKATWKRFETTKKHIEDFLHDVVGNDDLLLHEMKYSHVDDFFHYLRGKKSPCSHNTSVKYVKNLKKILNYSVEREYIEKNPSESFKVTLEEVETVFLTDEELKKLEEKEIPIERLSIIRDIFLFSCYTGLAYIDVQLLRAEHLVKNIDGGDWIHIKRAKTGTIARIMLLAKAKAILKKYKDFPCQDGQLLPIPSNQKVNAYLKEIAILCDIDKNLTSHVARHTFATHLLNQGVSMDTVGHQLGQKSIAQTQHYAILLGKTVSKEMKRYERKDKRGSMDEKVS